MIDKSIFFKSIFIWYGQKFINNMVKKEVTQANLSI